MLESELFGHEKGAFTGAVAQRAGRFELAHGGTLLLDEIGEISASFQAKLLRILQEGEFERVGGNRTLKVDVRLICATNKNLEQAVAKGEFRADLYYRINVIPVFLPPLRDRPGDIALLARAFVERFNAENGRKLAIASSGMEMLKRCSFPGNVRELENCVRRAATLTRGDVIGREDLSCSVGECLSSQLWTGGGHGPFDPIAELASGRTIAAPAYERPRPAPPPQPAPLPGARPSSARRSRGQGLRACGSGRVPGDRLTPHREGASARRHGARRLGAGQSRPHPRRHPAPDRLRAEEVPDRDEALLRAANSFGDARLVRTESVAGLPARSSAAAGPAGSPAMRGLCAAPGRRVHPKSCSQTPACAAASRRRPASSASTLSPARLLGLGLVGPAWRGSLSSRRA